ncbi:MAG: universal stress protein [Rhodospirillaceae bacterium]|nr:universal stress protein [Rhodospirillaceae bacterium]
MAATSAADINPRPRDPLIGNEANRLFLVVVDDSEELSAAIRYTCNRAKKTGGRVALLYVYDIEKDFQQFATVGNLMEQEAKHTAEEALKRHAAVVQQTIGRVPEMFVRKGNTREELFKLVAEHPEISILVLGAAPGKKPGLLVEAVTGKFAGKIGIPVTVVPGDLAVPEIDRLTSG